MKMQAPIGGTALASSIGYVWVQTSEGCSRLRDREVEWIRAGKPALVKLNGSQEYDFDGIKELHAIYEAQK